MMPPDLSIYASVPEGTSARVSGNAAATIVQPLGDGTVTLIFPTIDAAGQWAADMLRALLDLGVNS